MMSGLEAAFARAAEMEDQGLYIEIRRLPPSYLTGLGRCLGRWGWQVRIFRLIPDWVFTEVEDADLAFAIDAAVAAAKARLASGARQ